MSGGSLAKFARAIDVATAPSTIDVELLGDSFRPDLSVSATMVTNASGTIATAALLAAFVSDSSNNPSGWNTIVKPLLQSAGTVQRHSATSLTVTIPAATTEQYTGGGRAFPRAGVRMSCECAGKGALAGERKEKRKKKSLRRQSNDTSNLTMSPLRRRRIFNRMRLLSCIKPQEEIDII